MHDSVEEFRAIAEPRYRRDPVLFTVELTALRGSPPDERLLLTVQDGGEIVGSAVQYPPYPLLCNGIPVEVMGVVTETLAGAHPDLTGVRGTRETALAFAGAWTAATGTTSRVSTEERLYRLGTLREPARVPGDARDATNRDRGVLASWLDLFFQEAGGDEPDPVRSAQYVDDAERVGDRFLLWDVEDVPVSMAMARTPAVGVSRIGPVFTPYESRGHGYGSAVTAAAVEQVLSRGADEVVLFADLANPVSNEIYQRIGFEPVVDSIRIGFIPG